MSEDLSITSLLDEYANSTASFVRASASISAEQTKLNAAFSSSSNQNNSIQSMSDLQILSELKMDGLSSSKTASQIASDYNISITRAQQILDMLKSDDTAAYNINPEVGNSYSYVAENVSNSENTTVSYVV